MKLTAAVGKLLGVTVLCALMALEVHAATEAGRVAFAFGDVLIEGADGTQRTPRRGALVYSGDTITTGARGRVQIRYTDGSFMSLIPDTTFQIDEYRYDGEGGEEEKGFFSLVKGGLRAITGLVGKQDRANYRLSSVVSTIGIRGSHYRTVLERFGDTFRQLVSVGFDPNDPEGGITITAAGITVPVNPGQNAVVEGAEAPPRLTTEQARLAAAPPGDGGTDDVTAGADTDVEQSTLFAGEGESGLPAPGDGTQFGVLFGLDYPVAAVGPDLGEGMPVTDILPVDAFDIEESSFELFFVRDGAITGAVSDGETEEVAIDLIDTGIAQGFREVITQLDADLTGLTTDAEFDRVVDDFLSMPATNHDVGSDEATGIVWGRWAGGYVLVIDILNTTSTGGAELFASTDVLMDNQSIHWIYGPRATGLPTAGVAAFDVIPGAATPSTSLDGATIGAGLGAGRIRVDFNSLAVVGESLAVSHGGDIAFDTFGSLVPDPDGGGAGFLTSGSGTGSPCGSGCSAYLNGYLTNSGAEAVPNGATGAYKLAPNFGDGSGGDTIMGVGGFQLDHYNADGSIAPFF